MFFLAHLVELASHESLDRKYRIPRVSDGLTFRGLSNQTLPIFRESNDRRRRPRAFAILQNHRVATFHDGHAGVGGAQINP